MTAVARAYTCTCCGRRGARLLVQTGNPDRPAHIAVCPACDTRPDDTQPEEE